jgi:CheY-like chemotaxis protein
MPILVADDYADTAEAVALALKLEGFDTISVSSGDEALAAVADCRPTAAILDLRMPDMDGFTLAQHIRNSQDETVKTATLIAHSGLQSFEISQQAQKSGFDYLAIKPCPVEQLAVCLRLVDPMVPSHRLIAPLINTQKMIALSERSTRAVERAITIRATYRNLFRLLRDDV